MARPTISWPRWLAALALGMSAAHADIDPPRPTDQPSPRLIPICASVHERLCGLLDRDGRWVVEPTYSALYPEGRGGWYAERRGGVVGVLDAQGKVLIEPRFQYIGPFVDGLAKASLWDRDKEGYIDGNGDWVIPGQYFVAGDFVDGIAVVGQWVGGPDDGHSEMRYIDAQGKPAFPGTWTDAESFRYGMAMVGRGPSVRTDSNIDQAEAALIDRRGRYLMPMARRSMLTPIAPDRVLEQTATHYALLDSHGKVLFEVPPGNFLSSVGENRLAYQLEENGRYGLIDVLSGKVLVDAAHGWLGPPNFSDGVAWVETGENAGERRVLIDRNGRVLLGPVPYDGVTDFAAGIAAVGRNGKWQLIDRRGQALTSADYDGFSAAWADGRQSPRFGDVWVGKRGEREDWIGADGHVIARVEPQPCGIEAVFNGAGQAIWPRDIEAACAVYQEERPNAAATASVPAARLEAARLDRAREVLRWLGDVDRRDGPLSRLTARKSLSRQELLSRAPWQRGPAQIALGEGVSLALPEGYRYLPPEYAPAVIQASDGMLPPSPGHLPVALLAVDDLSVVLRVAVVAPGHVRMAGLPLDARALARRMQGGITGFAGTEVDDAHHSVEWLVSPRWNDAAKQLEWAYEDVSRGHASDHAFGQLYQANTLLFGRRQVVAMQNVSASLYGKYVALVAQDAMATLARGIRFASGERYEDAAAGEAEAPLDLVGYITTAPEPPVEADPPASAPSQGEAEVKTEAPAEERGPRMFIGLFLGSVVISLLLALWLLRGRRP